MKNPKELTDDELIDAYEHSKILLKFNEEIKEEIESRFAESETIKQKYCYKGGGLRTYISKNIPNPVLEEVFNILKDKNIPLSEFVTIKSEAQAPNEIREILSNHKTKIPFKASLKRISNVIEGGLENENESFPWFDE